MSDEDRPTKLDPTFPQTSDDQPESKSDETYQVGYGRPPLHTRFQKGSRGNGKGGRRKRATNIDDALDAEMAKVIEVRVNGKVRKMTIAEAIVQAGARRAISSEKGNLAFLRAVQSRSLRNRTHNEESGPELSPQETQRLIDEYIERARLTAQPTTRTDDEGGEK